MRHPACPATRRADTGARPLEKETDPAGHSYNSYRDNAIVRAVPVIAR